MRSNRSTVRAMDEAWRAIAGGAAQAATAMLTGVSPKALIRMRSALLRLEKQTPECVPARMTWREAMHAAKQAKVAAGAPRTVPSTDPEFVSALAGALAMLDADLPGALMEYWAAPNVTRGVRHVETQARD